MFISVLNAPLDLADLTESDFYEFSIRGVLKTLKNIYNGAFMKIVNTF